MSDTPSIGAVGPSHWTYVAAAMDRSLDKIVAAGRAEPQWIPRNVYEAAQKFFETAIEATGTPTPLNPLASIANYRIATDVFYEAFEHDLDRAEIENRLKSCASFLKRLSQLTPLTLDEIRTAQDLRKFFQQLARDGEIEAYERRIHGEFPDLTHR